MRILHLTDVYRPRVGGIEVFVEDLARRQQAAGHDVSILTSTRGPETCADGIPVHRTAVIEPNIGDVRAGRAVLLSGDYDVVHSHQSVVSPFSAAMVLVADRHGLPVVNTVHSMWAGREVWVRATGLLAGWARSRAVWTAVSGVAAADMHKVLGRDTGILVVPNAVDVDWWRARPDSDAPRPFTIVSVMRMAGRKRPHALLAMLERVRAGVPDSVPLNALLIGDGPLEKTLHAEIARRGLDSWVTMTGRLSRQEIRDLYGRTDVYVAPARQESFGIAALEARAAGVPVVAMRSGGVGEFIRDGVEGVLCADDLQMSLALTALAGDAALSGRMLAHNAATPPSSTWAGTLAGFDAAYELARERVHGPVPQPLADVVRVTSYAQSRALLGVRRTVREPAAGRIRRAELIPRRAPADQ